MEIGGWKMSNVLVAPVEEGPVVVPLEVMWRVEVVEGPVVGAAAAAADLVADQ